ncbi:hypothetical cytosolic protein [Coxiella burnetii CbuK_Q154]|nr:hypothetical cytosolic protein [Coxiella burnetii CbuK_Q154]
MYKNGGYLMIRRKEEKYPKDSPSFSSENPLKTKRKQPSPTLGDESGLSMKGKESIEESGELVKRIRVLEKVLKEQQKKIKKLEKDLGNFSEMFNIRIEALEEKGLTQERNRARLRNRRREERQGNIQPLFPPPTPQLSPLAPLTAFPLGNQFLLPPQSPFSRSGLHHLTILSRPPAPLRLRHFPFHCHNLLLGLLLIRCLLFSPRLKTKPAKRS